MTEINLFPKQPQSVTVLVFITVLIVLLLILTVMVHMRNRKLKSTLEEQMAERRLLDKICADFTAVYYVELNTGSFEILHINDGTNVKKMNLKQGDNFNSSADQYAVQYLYEKERQEFKDWISTGHLKEQLSRKKHGSNRTSAAWTGAGSVTGTSCTETESSETLCSTLRGGVIRNE